jgi:hypothetical protein
MSSNFKRLCFLVCLSFQFKAMAQNKVGLAQHQSLFYKLDTVGVLDISLGVDAQTSNQNFRYIHSLYAGKFISSQLIEDNGKMLNLNNKAGFESFIGGQYQFASKKNKKGLATANIIQAKYKLIAGGQYNSDAWLLAMKGNAPFAGEQISLSQVGAAQYQWLELGWGQKLWLKDNKMAVSFGLNVLGGQGNRFAIEKGTLYTDSAGQYLDVALNGNWARSNNAGQSLGLGAQFGLQGRINDKTEWQFNATDLGAFIPNKKAESNTFDTSFRFTGFYIYDVRDLSSNDYWTNRTDSLTAPIAETKGEKPMIWLPFKLNFGLHTFIKTNQQIGLIIGYRHLVYALPKLEVWHQVNYNSGFFINSNLAYGGWGGLQWTEKVGYQKARWAMALQLGGMQSMAISKLPFQATAQIQLVAKF